MREKHILIVDEDKAFTRTIVALLESHGYRVDVAHNGVDTLEKANQYPDLILLDRKLPDIGGLEVCKKIRRDKRLSHISIIVLAEQTSPTERAEGLHIGADDYIAKPVDNEELIARIEAVLRRNQVFLQNQEKKGVLVTELKRILKKELITPYFQPIYSMQSLMPLGMEALSRPPTSGLIDNAEFLFKTALILDMYSEVEILCWKKAVGEWQRIGGQKQLFLNCTPYFIESGRLNKDFLNQLNIDLKNVVLEITERTAIQKQGVFLERLHELKELGMKIAVDDVGSGFASLDTVVEIRPDIVKIDRRLIHNLHQDELRYHIVQAVVSFCKKSKIMVVAEGVEEEEELEAVRELGVDAVQGYLLGKPDPKVNLDIFTKKFGS